MSAFTWEDLDRMVEGDPLRMRDRAWAEIEALRMELAQLRSQLPSDPDDEDIEAWVRGQTSVLDNPELDAVTAMRRSRRV